MVSFRKFKNRGFLVGPIIPIYGLGATACYIGFNKIDSILIIFLLSGFSCCFLEYVVGTILENTFHQKFWDYSDWAFNIKGRTSLYCFLFFGIVLAICVKFIDPMFFYLASKIDSRILEAFASICMIYIVIDSFATLVARLNQDKNFTKPYYKIHGKIDDVLEGTSEKIKDVVPKEFEDTVNDILSNVKESSDKIKIKEEQVLQWIQ